LYAAKLRHAAPSGVVWLSDQRTLPTLRLVLGGGTDVTVVTYGGMVAEVERAAQEAFVEEEIRCEVFVPTQLQPLDSEPIVESVRRTRRLVVVEEGQGFAGFGAEVLARCAEQLGDRGWRGVRCHAADHPIPCARDRGQALPQAADILQAIQDTFTP
jgi:2-oxoisovalerate dehydrogenase E1 component